MQKNYLIYALALFSIIITFFVRYPLMTYKTLVTHDEAISYLAAAGKQDDYGRDISERKILGKYLPAYEWKKYLKSEKFFNFADIEESLLKSDVHPPFYFWILHVWNYFTGVDIQKGVLLNILIACLSTFLIFWLSLSITNSPWLSFIVTASWSLSYSWDATFYVRQYETLGFLSIAFYFVVYQLITKSEWRSKWSIWLLLAVITSLGLLTHIYFAPVAAGGLLFLFAFLLFNSSGDMQKNAIKFFSSLGGTIILTFLLYPRYLQFINELLNRSAQNSPNPVRELYFKDSLYTLFFGLSGRYAYLANNFPNKGLYIFLTIILVLLSVAGLILFFSKKKHSWASLFLPTMLVWNTALFSALYKALKLADWAIGGKYYAHIIPLVPLTIAAIAKPSKNKEKIFAFVLTGVFLVTVLSGTIFYLNDLTSRKVFKPEVLFKHYPRIVCDNTARGDLFGLVMYLPEGALLYVDTQDNLINAPDNWAPFFRPGDMLVCIDDYDSTKDKQPLIVQAFEQATGKKLKFYPGYVSNVYLYVLME